MAYKKLRIGEKMDIAKYETTHFNMAVVLRLELRHRNAPITRSLANCCFTSQAYATTMFHVEQMLYTLIIGVGDPYGN